MNNRITYALLLAVLFFSGQSLVAQQDRVVIRVNDIAVIASEGQFCIPVIADSFPDIGAMQFSMVWDASVLEYVDVAYGDNPLDIMENTSNTPTDSTFGISWLATGQVGITLDPGTTILELCFNPLVSEGFTTLSFESFLAPEFVQAGTVSTLPFRMEDGSVTVSETELQAVLPGDTNLDSLVNADDLLNIGLGFGFTGPERDNASTDFSPQLAPVWASATPVSGVNYCHANADGDAIIGSDDQAVMEANYGQSLLAAWEPPVILQQAGAMPLIELSGGPLTSGELGTLEVRVGSEDQPVGVGYGISFGIQFDPNQFDIASVTVDFSESFLGTELLTFADFYPNELGLLEIAATRTDQENSTMAGGLVCTISIRPTAGALSDFEAEFFTTPYRYIDKDENATALVQSISRIQVESPLSVVEPLWGRDLRISPNPLTVGEQLVITGVSVDLDKIELVDAQGRLVRRINAADRSVQLDGLSPGLYTLRLRAGTEVVGRKLLVR